MATLPITTQDYDYTVGLSDETDTLQFGKYRGVTPVELLAIDPGYIVWATNKTAHWVGSKEIVAAAARAAKKLPLPPAPRKPAPTPTYRDQTIQQCEEAILHAYGAFPKPLWMQS